MTSFWILHSCADKRHIHLMSVYGLCCFLVLIHSLAWWHPSPKLWISILTSVCLQKPNSVSLSSRECTVPLLVSLIERSWNPMQRFWISCQLTWVEGERGNTGVSVTTVCSDKMCFAPVRRRHRRCGLTAGIIGWNSIACLMQGIIVLSHWGNSCF